MKKLLIFTLFVVFGSSLGYGQEQIYIHFDKPFYTTGEVMWYKLYYPASLKDKEFNIKVSVTDAKGSIKESWCLQSEGNGQSNGYLNIPYNWTSGNYGFHLTGLDVASKKSVRIGHVVIPVFNDLEPLSSNTELVRSMSKAPSAVPMKVFLGNSDYAPGSTITADVNSTVASGQKSANLSVSVVDAEIAAAYGSSIKSIRWSNNAQLDNQYFLDGRITDENGAAMASKVFGAYTPIDDRIYYLKTDDNGYFTLRTPTFSGNRTYQFIAGEGNPLFNVELNKGIAGIDLGNAQITEAVLAYVKLSQDRKKITQYFGQSKDPIAKESMTFKMKKEKPEDDYVISEYQAFENVAEFFIEIRSPLTFKLDRDTNLIASISKPVAYYTVRGQKDDPPIFIIDGKITKDGHYVGKTRLELIKSAELFYNPTLVNKKYKTLGSGGVVKLLSKNNDFFLAPEEERHIVNVSGTLLEGTFKDRSELDNGKPWYTPQVYWNPSVTPNAQGRANIAFTQSDDISTFVIQIVGIKEDGSLTIGDQVYNVK